jgi:hypothetical protein
MKAMIVFLAVFAGLGLAMPTIDVKSDTSLEQRVSFQVYLMVVTNGSGLIRIVTLGCKSHPVINDESWLLAER